MWCSLQGSAVEQGNGETRSFLGLFNRSPGMWIQITAQNHSWISQMSSASPAEMTHRRQMLNFRVSFVPQWGCRLEHPPEIYLGSDPWVLTGTWFPSKTNRDHDKCERGEVQACSGKLKVLRQVSESGCYLGSNFNNHWKWEGLWHPEGAAGGWFFFSKHIRATGIPPAASRIWIWWLMKPVSSITFLFHFQPKKTPLG